MIWFADAQTSGSSQVLFVMKSVAHAACNLLESKGLLSPVAELLTLCEHEWGEWVTRARTRDLSLGRPLQHLCCSQAQSPHAFPPALLPYMSSSPAVK